MTVANFLARLSRVKRGGRDSWSAACPGHEDTKNSLSVKVADQKILVHCLAGCDTTIVLAKLSLHMRDLFLDPPVSSRSRTDAQASAPGPPLTLQAFATAKGLPWGLQITYRLRDGSPALRQRKRTALSAREGSSWLGPKGKPPNAYGLWRLDDTHETGELLIVEGETDTLTAWLHAVPCLGLPGADMAHCLEPRPSRVWIGSGSSRSLGAEVSPSSAR
jgi:hypothetical protein